MKQAVFLAIAVVAVAQVPDVGPFPKPDPARTFSQLKILGQDGSPLRKAREDWDGARHRVETDPSWREWLQRRRAEADDWMSKRRDKVEWVAGWWHDFVSPKDGSFLTFTPDEPGDETLSSPSDPKVRLTPKLHGGWVFGFRSRHTEMVWETARLYLLTGERKYADWAASQLDFYADHYLEWPIQTQKSKARLMHQSLDDANVLVRLVNAARLLDRYAGAERRQKWIAKLFRPEAELLDETMQRVHNIASWQRCAMAQAAIYSGDAELWKRAVDGPFGIRKQIAHGVTSDYIWFEQSLQYNTYVASAYLPLFTMASLEGRDGELEREMHAIENLMLAPIFMRFPDGRSPNPADSTGGVQRAPNVRLLASAYRIFPTAIGLDEARNLRSWDTLLDPPETAPARPQLPSVESRNMPSSQMAIIRRGPWQVYFHYGQLHSSHAQAEALNYEAYYGDTDISHDPGTVGYGSPLHTGFYRTPAAHNVPVVDVAGQDKWRPGELLGFAAHRVSARQPQYRPGVEASRELNIDGKSLIDTLALKAAAPSRLGTILHLQGQVERPSGATPVDAPLPYWRGTVRSQHNDSAVLRVAFGNLSMRVRIETPGPFTVTVGQSPDMPPASRDSIYVETNGTQAKFKTTFEPE